MRRIDISPSGEVEIQSSPLDFVWFLGKLFCNARELSWRTFAKQGDEQSAPGAEQE